MASMDIPADRPIAVPAALLVILGVIFLLQGNTSAAPMNSAHLLPEWTGIASLVLIVNNFLAYSGMEMNAVHVSSPRNPRGEFPKAMFLAVGLVLLIFILPALAISWVILAEQLSLTAGVMQAFNAFFGYFGPSKLVPIAAIALVCASTGGMLTWLAGPSKGLLLIARRRGCLPPFFQEQNEHEIPVHILVTQGAITTVIAKARQLTRKLQQAGPRAPTSQDTIIRSLGGDGGPVCENPADALGQAVLFDQLRNGASFVGERPIIVDRRIVEGERLILEVYCPDKLTKYDETIEHLEYEGTIRQ